MSGAYVDADVLEATRKALASLAGDVPGLLSRADSLDVGSEVSGLRSLPGWATDMSNDLKTRIDLVHKIESHDPSLKGTGLNQAELWALAGGRQSVSYSMNVLALLPDLKRLGFGKDGILLWDGSRNFSDYIDNIKSRAIDKLPEGAEINKVLEFKSNLEAIPGDFGTIKDGIKRSKSILDFYRNGKALKAPESLGRFDRWIVDKVLTGNSFEKTLQDIGSKPKVADFLARNPWAQDMMSRSTAFARSPLMARINQASEYVFGKPWVRAGGEVVDRGATNLLEVYGAGRASGLTRLSSLAEAGRVAGGLRVLGVAGSALATADDVWGNVSDITSGQVGRDWNSGTQGKAKVIGEFAKTGFDASMTAAMIAPNPITLGAVAVTGLVYGGAELVQHWDAVTHAVSKAADWVGDKAGDAYHAVSSTVSNVASDVTDTLGDAADAVKDSPLNPGNWF